MKKTQVRSLIVRRMCASKYANDDLDYDDAVRWINQQQAEDNMAVESLRNGSGDRKAEGPDQQFYVKLLIWPFDMQ
ncbi:MAG: hypothetical protein ABI977_37275 [Acidobacteriota bacterium]